MRNTIKLYTSIGLLILLTTLSEAQQQCTLTLDAAPELRGFKLGMEFEKVKALFPRRTYWSEVTYGLREIYLTEGDLLLEISQDRGKGVMFVELEFIDNRLTYIGVHYDNSVQFKDNTEFKNKVAEALGLKGNWQSDNGRSSEFYLDCQEFIIVVDGHSNVGPEVSMYIPGARDVVKKRRQEAEEKKRRNFKP